MAGVRQPLVSALRARLSHEVCRHRTTLPPQASWSASRCTPPGKLLLLTRLDALALCVLVDRQPPICSTAPSPRCCIWLYGYCSPVLKGVKWSAPKW